MLQEHVASYAGARNGYFSVSRTGTLAWRAGTAVVSQAVVFDRMGKRVAIAGTPLPVNIITLSPDESRLLAQGEAGLWILETNGTGRVGIKLDGSGPAHWAADGSQVIFINGMKLLELPVSGSVPARELADIPGFGGLENPHDASTDRTLFVNGSSQDGRQLLFGDFTGLMLFALDGKTKPERVVTREADNAAISPDGSWMVYHPNEESGVYAQPVARSAIPTEIASIGNFAVWRGDGKEILYFDRMESTVCSVRVAGSGPKLTFSAPQRLFKVVAPMGLNSGSRPLAVNYDGSRIYFLQSTEQPESGVINVRTGAVR